MKFANLFTTLHKSNKRKKGAKTLQIDVPLVGNDERNKIGCLIAVKQSTLYNLVFLQCNKHVNENTNNGTYIFERRNENGQ